MTYQHPGVNQCARPTCCSSELTFRFLYAGSSIPNASKQFVSYIHLSFVNFPLNPTPRINLSELVLKIQTALSREPYGIRDTCSYELFFSQWPIMSTPKIMTSPESPRIASNCRMQCAYRVKTNACEIYDGECGLFSVFDFFFVICKSQGKQKSPIISKISFKKLINC